MALTDRISNPQGHAVHVERGRLLERANDEGDQVRRHLHGGGEAHVALSVAEICIGHNRRVRVHRELARDGEIDLVRRFKGRLVPTRERTASVGVFELGGGDGVRDAVVVGERGAIKPVELVVQNAVEGNFQHGRPRGKLTVKDEGHRLVGLVESVLERAVTGAVSAQRGGAEFELDGVQGQLSYRFANVDVNFDAPGEGEGFEVRGEKDSIGRRDDGAGETVGVSGCAHKSLL